MAAPDAAGHRASDPEAHTFGNAASHGAQVFQSVSVHSTLRDEASRPLPRWAGPAAAGRCRAAAGGLGRSSPGVSARGCALMTCRAEAMRSAPRFPLGTQLGFAGGGGPALLPAPPCTRQIVSNPCPAHCCLLCRTARLHHSRWQRRILERSCCNCAPLPLPFKPFPCPLPFRTARLHPTVTGCAAPLDAPVTILSCSCTLCDDTCVPHYCLLLLYGAALYPSPIKPLRPPPPWPGALML